MVYLRAMLRQLFFLLNLLLLAAIFLAGLSCHISPENLWWLAFVGLGYTGLLVGLLLCTVASALFCQKIFFLNIIALALSWSYTKTVFAPRLPAIAKAGINVMSYNVKNFDLYNWTGNKETRHQIFEMIRLEAPAILCLQEFYTDDKEYHNLEYLRDSLGYSFVYFKSSNTLPRTNQSTNRTHPLGFGLAIFSRYEILDTGIVSFEDKSSNQCIYTDLNVAGKPLRVYNTHLQSIHLGYDDYDTLEELRETQNTQWYRLKNILRKMKHAYTKRARQAQAIAAHNKQHQGALLICGDFNDAPVSYTYHTIAQNLQDAFVEKGSGIGNSFVNRLGFFRIDFVLGNSGVRFLNYRVPNKALSDHYPIKVVFAL